MSKLDLSARSGLSPMFGPKSAWHPGYDVTARLTELEKFWTAGVTAALYDALKQVKCNPDLTAPKWILDATLSVVGDRLQAGFATKKTPGKRNDERKIYQSEIAAYYRWREVWKSRLSGHTLEAACIDASDQLAETEYAGETETMRKAYNRVSRDLNDPNKAFRYYSAMEETREIAGTSFAKKTAKKT